MNDNPVARWTVLALVALTMFFAYMFVDKDLKAAYPQYKFGEGKLLNRIEKSEVEKWAGAVK